MFRSLISAACIAALACAAAVGADDKAKKDDEVAKAMSKIAQLGPGVHAIKKDDKGRIQSCIIVGTARISTVLGAAKGLETAREKARLAASAEFVKWLKEKVSVHSKSEEETILFLEGSEGNDKETMKESGKAIEKTSKKMESISEGLTRGMQVLHFETSDKDKTYILVLGWDAKTSEATKDAGKDKKVDKKIDDKKVTSPDAEKFLPK